MHPHTQGFPATSLQADANKTIHPSRTELLSSRPSSLQLRPVKTLLLPFLPLIGLAVSAVGATTDSPTKLAAEDLVGAWQIEGEPKHVLTVTANYWSIATFSPGKFERTRGGTYVINPDSTARSTIQFDSAEPQEVGQDLHLQLRLENDTLHITPPGESTQIWTRLDRAENPLAGVWRINGRNVNGTIQEMPLRARRTLKILSGTRFQWVAINIETGEFSGTGGGTFTFENGRYVEKIDFFSRDNSRVGAELSFGGEVSGDTWRHHGLSSRGDPIDERWIRFQP